MHSSLKMVITTTDYLKLLIFKNILQYDVVLKTTIQHNNMSLTTISILY